MKTIHLTQPDILALITRHVEATHGLRHVRVDLERTESLTRDDRPVVSAVASGEPSVPRYACGCAVLPGIGPDGSCEVHGVERIAEHVERLRQRPEIQLMRDALANGDGEVWASWENEPGKILPFVNVIGTPYHIYFEPPQPGKERKPAKCPCCQIGKLFALRTGAGQVQCITCGAECWIPGEFWFDAPPIGEPAPSDTPTTTAEPLYRVYFVPRSERDAGDRHCSQCGETGCFRWECGSSVITCAKCGCYEDIDDPFWTEISDKVERAEYWGACSAANPEMLAEQLAENERLSRKADASLRTGEALMNAMESNAADMALLEELAAVEHNLWTDWMHYAIEKDSTYHHADGSVTLSAEDVRRWRKQIYALYADLPDDQKDNYRREARRTIEIMRKHPRALREAKFEWVEDEEAAK